MTPTGNAAGVAEAMRLYKVAALAQAFVRSGLMEDLAVPSTVESLARARAADADALRIVLDALRAIGFVERDGETYSATFVASPGEAEALKRLATYHAARSETFAQHHRALLGIAGEEARAAADLANGMRAVHVPHSLLYESLLAGIDRPCILDIGGGSGLCAEEVLAIHPRADVWILDPRWYAADSLASRVTYCSSPGAVPLARFDLVLFMNSMHCLRRAELIRLLDLTVRSLRRSGHVVIQEFLAGDGAGRMPPEFLLAAQMLDGIVVDWPLSELDWFLANAGLEVVNRTTTEPGYLSYPSQILTLRPRGAEL